MPERCNYIESIHYGHLQIENNEVRIQREKQIRGFGRICRRGYRQISSRKDSLQKFNISALIIDYEHSWLLPVRWCVHDINQGMDRSAFGDFTLSFPHIVAMTRRMT